VRRLVAFAAFAAVLVACASPSSAPAAEPSTSPPAIEPSRLDYYEPLIREMAGLEGSHDSPLYIRTEICSDAADPGTKRECEDAFTAEEQQDLGVALTDIAPTITFVPDWEHLGLDIENRDHATMVWVGAPEEKGDDLWIGAGMWCGGLCGHGGTFVVRPQGDGWVVDGTAPGTGMWIS
jgi:hypothetical protein